jgi:maltose alpha-D-glucosyltransferase/alpha-amylase
MIRATLRGAPFSLWTSLVVAAVTALGCGDDTAPTPPPRLPERDWEAEAQTLLEGPDWYRHAVFYEAFVRSLQDSDGDGIGDLPGLTSRLDELEALGVDALWLMPIMPTPFFDSGYDVSDYEDVNPDYGSLDDFDALVTEAHARGVRVVIDLVLNHTSNEHAWFEASRSDPTGEYGDFYVWSDTASDPDVGCSVHQDIFGDSAWELDPVRGQYYFHRFYPEQPDLNYRNPAVVARTLDVARFWLDRGVDGFRCDVIALLYESATQCEMLDETIAYIRPLRALVDEYPGAVLVAESTDFNDASPYFGDGSDMFHMAFNFAYGYFWGFHFGGYSSRQIEAAFAPSLETYPAGAQDALVIGSHDVPRAYAVAVGDESRHRRAALIQMTMRGTPFIYYGEELGLRPGTDEVVDNRDSARTPMPWTGGAGFGFTEGTPWLDFAPDAETTNAQAEDEDAGSMLRFYRELLALRRGRAVWGTGAARILVSDSDAVFTFVRDDGDLTYLVAVNMTSVERTVTYPDARLGSAGQRELGHGTLVVDGDAATVTVAKDTGVVFRLR